MKIYEALKRDHDKVKDLISDLVSLDETDEDTRQDLINEISDELIPHSRAEEAVFYNSIRASEKTRNFVRHAYQDHMEAETLLRTLQIKNKIDAEWRDTAKKLQKALDHHIQEEESRTFAVARSIFSEDEAEKLGEAFEKMKPEVKAEGFMARTADLLVNLMPTRFSNKLRGQKDVSSGLSK